MGNAWGREQQPGLAAKKILDAAEKAFIELGISRAGMASIAEFAGCSRGTLYRYFKSRHELHLAYVNRAALRIVEHVRVEMAGIRDPRERLVRIGRLGHGSGNVPFLRAGGHPDYCLRLQAPRRSRAQP
jgi:AcrR family transcriptional regulator